MASTGKKSLRQFLCSDALWNTFERMAEEQEKGIDELISDALVSYAQLAGYHTGISVDEADESGPITPPPARQPLPSPSRPRAPPPPPPMPPVGARFGRPIPSPGSGLNAMGILQASPAPSGGADGTPGGSAAPPLYLVFDNQKYRIDKDQFIIGRGSKSSDLPIKDGNLSRNHAAVIPRNATYFINHLAP